MNEKCVCSCSDDLILHPKHLRFGPPRLDGNRLTARAEIEQPSTPVHMLIVSTVLPDTGQQEAKAEFSYLLADLEADFQLEARRDDDDLPDDPPDDPDPESSDDPGSILIRPVLREVSQDREFGVAFEFIASTPPSGPQIFTLSTPLGDAVPIQGGARVHGGHVYRRSDGEMIHAKLTSLVGSEILNPGDLVVTGPGDGNSRRTHGRGIGVRNHSNYRVRYTLTGNFGLHVQVSAAARPVLAADRDRDTES
jgi:hypothetical protein